MWDAKDRGRRLEWLERRVEEHGWRLHAFVLMGNHEHLFVHLNPVRAGLVRDPQAYRWSRFPGYCRRSRELEWVRYDRVLAEHGPGARSVRRRRYAAFVRRGMEEALRPPWESAWHGLVVGSEAFLERIRSRVGLGEGDPEVSGSRELAKREPVEAVVGQLAEALGVELSEWRPERRSESGERAVVA